MGLGLWSFFLKISGPMEFVCDTPKKKPDSGLNHHLKKKKKTPDSKKKPESVHCQVDLRTVTATRLRLLPPPPAEIPATGNHRHRLPPPPHVGAAARMPCCGESDPPHEAIRVLSQPQRHGSHGSSIGSIWLGWGFRPGRRGLND